MKVFISHGSGMDREVEAARKCIVAHLTDRGYDVFTDVDKLRVGDEWHPVLFEEMYLCDAAIVLLGPRTIRESDWVRREAEVLMSRHIVRSLRTVLPVFIGTQDTKEARRRGFGHLLNIQAEFGRRESNPMPEGTDVTQFAEWITAEFAPIVGPVGVASEFHQWASRISGFLRSARLRDFDTVVDAATALCCTDDEILHVRARVGAELFLAHVLLREGEKVRDGEADSALPGALAALRPGLLGNQLTQLKEEIVPGWVDPADAEVFASPPADGTAKDRPLVLLSAYAEWTAEQHVRRTVYNAPGSYRLRGLPESRQIRADESTEEEALMAMCNAALKTVFGVPPNMPLAPGHVRQRQTGEYLVIDSTGRQLRDIAAVVNRIHADFPWVTVIVLIPDGAPTAETLRELGIDRAVPVTLSHDVELRAFRLDQMLGDVAGATG
ncbi:toll/interleukin-1 receptor domain-containing protein [Streptomyces mirabilis]|uniref:toll/interleukin-1 receptor domain-containing protein n=1 Tax=Streptomyces mirabilis TaxID=68239 RepID=UPI0028F6D493|nr:toll/interleukin-1 receptor domain-containing protein [Streptomyces mirabilis]